MPLSLRPRVPNPPSPGNSCSVISVVNLVLTNGIPPKQQLVTNVPSRAVKEDPFREP
jgi:hypothetical protein